jgi:biopolymer transport protein ExbD
MKKGRRKGSDEILLVPFLDILCSLIGVLVLIIVVLCVAQSQQTQGRTQEEIRMAQEYKEMVKEEEARKKLHVQVTAKMVELEKLKKDLENRQERYLMLRKLISSSAETREQNRQISQKLQKELDDLLTEIDGITRQFKESKQLIAKLEAELKERQIKKDTPLPAVVVQPSGSGMTEQTKVYFVECGSGYLKILGAWGNEEYRLSAQASTVIADAAYKHFLNEVSKDKNALVLFLIRSDGQNAYNLGAGHAEDGFNIRTGKLPIPGGGKLELAMFDKFRGKISSPPPPESVTNPLPKKS